MSWRATEEQKMSAPWWAHFAGGGLGAMVSSTITSPLEVVKIRLQAQNHKSSFSGAQSHYFGMRTFASVRALLYQEGIRGLYRGLIPTFAGVIPSRSIHFLVYGTAKTNVAHLFPSKDHWAVPMLASALAGATVTTVTCPLWTVKTRLQLQVNSAKETLYNGIVDAFIKIYKNEGFRALYKGLGTSYLGLVETVIQFTLYEYTKDVLLRKRPEETRTLAIHEYLILSSIAKFVASASTYPHEVIRTRLREQRGVNGKYRGPFQGLLLIAREEGRVGLYGGMGAHLIRSVPNAAILFLVYELTLTVVTRTEET